MQPQTQLDNKDFKKVLCVVGGLYVSDGPLYHNLSMAIGITAHVGDTFCSRFHVIRFIDILCHYSSKRRRVCKSSEEKKSSQIWREMLHHLNDINNRLYECLLRKEMNYVSILVVNIFTRKLHRVPLNSNDRVANGYWSAYFLDVLVYSISLMWMDP